MKHCFLHIILLVFAFSLAKAQNIRMGSFESKALESAAYTQGNFHTSIQPWQEQDFDQDMLDSARGSWEYKLKSKPTQVLINQSFVEFNTKKFNLSLDPVFDFTFWRSPQDTAKSAFKTLGFDINAKYGKKWAANFNMRYSNSGFPAFLEDKIAATNAVPGQGYGGKMANGQYQYANGSGYVSFTPTKYFNIQAGHGKNAIGDGYRSLLLSYGANNYNYLRLTTSFWKLRYTNLYTAFKDIRNSGGNRDLFQNKFGTIHYLDWNISKSVSLGIFEAVIWQGEDTLGYRGYDVNYLNPIIFYRPVEFSLGSPDNVLLGINTKVKFLKRNFFYGQLLLDEFLLAEVLKDLKYSVNKDESVQSGWWANKQAFQLGVKGYDPFKLKGLFYQAELNFVRPYTYTHITIRQNYGHFGEPLAHPLGANFIERLVRASYRYEKFYVDAKLIYSTYGADSSNVSYGQNIYRSYLDRQGEYGNRMLQGLKTNLLHGEINFAYVINAKTNLRAELGMISRRTSNENGVTKERYFLIGLKTSLSDYFYDY